MSSAPLLPRGTALAGALLLTLSACGGATDGEGGAAGGPSQQGGRGGEDALQVTTSFYPMTNLAREVGGDHVQVSQLTPDGADPHHFELSPKQTGAVQEAELVVHLGSMQPAVDAAVKAVAQDSAWDAAEATELEAKAHELGVDEGHEGEGHEGHDHGPVDPHYWLDPVTYGESATALAEELAELDPDHAADYRENARAYVQELTALDEELEKSLSSCRQDTLVVAHEAYGWFTARYGLDQLAASGLNNEAEVSPQRLAELTRLIEDAGVSTIYAEPLTPQDNAQTLAAETGTEVEVLDPAAGITEDSPAQDYLGIMEHNREVLVAGQECS